MIVRTRILAWLLVVGFATTARAELTMPRLDRIQPIGGNIGSTVIVEVTGPDLVPIDRVWTDHPGITVEKIDDKKVHLKIATTVPAAVYDLRVSNRFGVSNPRSFAVSHGLTDILKSGKNQEFESAQLVPMNAAIAGATNGNQEDFYRFPGKKGQRIVVDCHAARLESGLDANLRLMSRDGRILATAGDTYGRDPMIDAILPDDGEFWVAVADLTYRGGEPYRLIISDRPQFETVFPSVMQVGKPTSVRVLGRNLGAGSKSLPSTGNGPGLEERTETLTIPAEVVETGRFPQLTPAIDHSPNLTATTATVRGFHYCPTWDTISARAQPILLVDHTVTLEQEPNAQPEQAQKVTLPAAIAGRFETAQDADWYELTATEKTQIVAQVYCERLAGRVDPVVTVFDDKGNRMAEFDDYGHRVNSFDGFLRDPVGNFEVQANQKVRILVQDRYRRGNERAQYVLTLRKPTVDFYPIAIHQANGQSGSTILHRGGATTLDLVVHMEPQMQFPVTVTPISLPPGVHAKATTLVGNVRSTIVLWADESADANWTGPIRFLATGTKDGQTIRREVRAYTRIGNESSSRPTRDLMLAIREQAPFRAAFTQPTITAQAGQKLTLKVEVKRFWPGYTGKITLQPIETGGNFSLPNVEIPENQTSVDLSFEIPKNVSGEFTVSYKAQSQVPYRKDPKQPVAMTLFTSAVIPTTISVPPSK
ncbi:hypothetical protein [Tuwongella immobilis]|uniref:Hypothetical conserved protein n=1 Tax=Tuwongella immobilis TaxID=692036 RepID=A0A6C2YMH8_9BACT|nr:hypothetical protein [Tuwongella immobilis]VIP02567.1 Hypothetical conserved protein OS=uncultured planctomycete GN=HGMM_F07G10C28 PE=4 SV=1 [Tuwongella immobilis]VTS01790.1 Hypothetical conserved protein OS=uncultured planctomycete GN=HGMM_F07G10C28 PE=4 SV=1 [Tuwongella immobilis]